MRVRKNKDFPYQLARSMGDIQAISSGSPKKMTKRVGPRVTGRAASKVMWNLFSRI